VRKSEESTHLKSIDYQSHLEQREAFDRSAPDRRPPVRDGELSELHQRARDRGRDRAERLERARPGSGGALRRGGAVERGGGPKAAAGAPTAAGVVRPPRQERDDHQARGTVTRVRGRRRRRVCGGDEQRAAAAAACRAAAERRSEPRRDELARRDGRGGGRAASAHVDAALVRGGAHERRE